MRTYLCRVQVDQGRTFHVVVAGAWAIEAAVLEIMATLKRRGYTVLEVAPIEEVGVGSPRVWRVWEEDAAR